MDLRMMTEAEWMRQVTSLATQLGWKTYHTRAGRDRKGWTTPVTSRGFPDLLLIRPPRLIVAELKSEEGKLGPDQDVWLDAFRACGIPAYLWRPSDLEEVAKVLGPRG